MVCAIHRAFFIVKKMKNEVDMSTKTSPVTAADLAKNAYKQQYGVIVICFDEAQQIAVYEAMKQQYPNNKIKVVTT